MRKKKLCANVRTNTRNVAFYYYYYRFYLLIFPQWSNVELPCASGII